MALGEWPRFLSDANSITKDHNYKELYNGCKEEGENVLLKQLSRKEVRVPEEKCRQRDRAACTICMPMVTASDSCLSISNRIP